MSAIKRLEADIVVVGGGGAGLSAALEAAASRRHVLLLEKNPYLGGTTRLSVGSVSACRTPHQRRKGIQDSPREFAEDMGRVNEQRGLDARDNLELRRLLAEESSDTFRWLVGMGIEFFGPMPEPPNRAPRMHNVLPSSSAYIYALARQARKRGVQILLEIRVDQLLMNHGRVTGVNARSADGGRVEVLARRGVVLASGDYSSSVEMKTAYLGPEVAAVQGINPMSTGDAHRMGLEVGARLVNADLCLGPEIRFVAPPHKPVTASLPPVNALGKVMNLVASRLPASLLRPVILAFLTTYLAPSPRLFAEGAILVNGNGERFANELQRPAVAVPRQPDQVAFIVFDDRVAQRFSRWPYFVSTAPGVAYAFLADYRRSRRDVYAQAATVEGLAQTLKVPAKSLTVTVAEYNRGVDRKTDSAFGRDSLGQGLNVPPYHALGPAKSWIVLTDGGLAVTPRMEVLDERGRIIPGLYAAGSTGQGGVLLEGHGLRLCWAFTSGRLAGRHAADN